MRVFGFIVLMGLTLSGCSALIDGRPCTVQENKIPAPVIHKKVSPRKIEKVATIYFADGSVFLTEEEKETLYQIAKKAKELDAEILIRGHASSHTRSTSVIEHTLINLNISSRRALKIVKVFGEYGVPLRQMRYEALSDSQPAEPEINKKAEALNRRVEIFYAY